MAEQMMIVGDRVDELRNEGQKLIRDAKEIFLNEKADAQDREKATRMLARVDDIKSEIDSLVQIAESEKALMGTAKVENRGGDRPAKQIGSLGRLLVEVFNAEFGRKSVHPGLKRWRDPEEPAVDETKIGWVEPGDSKDLLESVGASGGYLVPVQQGESLLVHPGGTDSVVTPRATVIPMRRRQIQLPALNQGATTAGQPHWFGGIIAKWTEEATEKDETQPSFRRINLTAFKLALYTEASDELLMDNAVSLEAFLNSAFGGAIDWYKEHAYVQGTGAGQPLGIIPAPGTITIPPAAIGAIAVSDFADMLEAFVGRSPIWMMSRQWMSDLIELNGPAGNPSYVFMPSARDGVPGSLFGYPVFFSEHMPQPGEVGSVALCDWSKYLIGDRQAVTVDASKHFRFQNDLTAWRAVSRVGGRPWLDLPLTYSDGTTQVSPFVILGIHPTS